MGEPDLMTKRMVERPTKLTEVAEANVEHEFEASHLKLVESRMPCERQSLMRIGCSSD